MFKVNKTLKLMSDLPVFEPEHNCICAYPDVPILDFYKGFFECVYIILHPFTKLADENISLSWSEFLKLSGFADIKQLDIALRNSIGGLNVIFRNQHDVDILNETLGINDLAPPSEGSFQKVLIRDMISGLLEQGYEHMFIADEHGLERKHMYTNQAIDAEGKPQYKLSAADNWYTEKNEVLYTTHWDSFFTLICSDKETVEQIVTPNKFEGFYCDEKTEIYWSIK